MRALLKYLFERISRIGRKRDFATRVLDRYRANAPVSEFARDLFKSETRETINARFERALQEVEKS